MPAVRLPDVLRVGRRGLQHAMPTRRKTRWRSSSSASSGCGRRSIPNGQRVIIGGNPRNMTEAERKSIGTLVLPVDRAGEDHASRPRT